jgi:putative ATPase
MSDELELFSSGEPEELGLSSRGSGCCRMVWVQQDSPLAARMRPEAARRRCAVRTQVLGGALRCGRMLEGGACLELHPLGASLERQDHARPAPGPTRADAAFVSFSAVTEGVARVREIDRRGPEPGARPPGRRTILFCDEIHRFNKAQQDAFLPHVEDGTVILVVGATTENPVLRGEPAAPLPFAPVFIL